MTENLRYTFVHEDRRAGASSRYLGADTALGGASGQGGRECERCDEELRALSYHDLPLAAGGEARRGEGVASAPTPGAEPEADAGAEAEGAALDQWQGSAAVWF